MSGKSDIYFEHMGCALRVMPKRIQEAAVQMGRQLTGIRLRPGRPVQFEYRGGDVLTGPTDRQEFDCIVESLMGHSLYARENELAQGYFSLKDGSRVGVSGRYAGHRLRSVADISSVNIRIACEAKGCADELIGKIRGSGGVLIVSPPGMGKTTVLREIARMLSEEGRNICIIDERDELAACVNGTPALDVGPRTDVICGMEKHAAMIMAVRSMAPDVIVADEMGDERDAGAVYDALRCGIKVIASAHGDSLDVRRMRPVVAELVRNGAFSTGVLLGPETGMIAQIKAFDMGDM